MQHVTVYSHGNIQYLPLKLYVYLIILLYIYLSIILIYLFLTCRFTWHLYLSTESELNLQKLLQQNIFKESKGALDSFRVLLLKIYFINLLTWQQHCNAVDSTCGANMKYLIFYSVK